MTNDKKANISIFSAKNTPTNKIKRTTTKERIRNKIFCLDMKNLQIKDDDNNKKCIIKLICCRLIVV